MSALSLFDIVRFMRDVGECLYDFCLAFLNSMRFQKSGAKKSACRADGEFEAILGKPVEEPELGIWHVNRLGISVLPHLQPCLLRPFFLS